jgi:hypothetical protein
MQDFQTNIVNEMNDVKSLVSARPVTNEMGTDPQEFMPTPMTQQASTSTRLPKLPPMTPNVLFDDVDDVADMLQNVSFAQPSTSQPQKATRQTEAKRRETLEDMTLQGLQDIYYSKKKGGRGSGAVIKNRTVMINRILDLDFHGKEF